MNCTHLARLAVQDGKILGMTHRQRLTKAERAARDEVDPVGDLAEVPAERIVHEHDVLHEPTLVCRREQEGHVGRCDFLKRTDRTDLQQSFRCAFPERAAYLAVRVPPQPPRPIAEFAGTHGRRDAAAQAGRMRQAIAIVVTERPGLQGQRLSPARQQNVHQEPASCSINGLLHNLIWRKPDSTPL